MISALVLAAGEGTRFGGTKQLEILRDKPLVQHAVDAASGGGVDDIVVVLGHDALRVRDGLDLPEGARFVVNERYADGQSTSLAAGLRALDPRTKGAVVLLADQPGIRARHVRSLVTAFETDPAEILRIRFRDGPGPAILARSVWDEARAEEATPVKAKPTGGVRRGLAAIWAGIQNFVRKLFGGKREG